MVLYWPVPVLPGLELRVRSLVVSGITSPTGEVRFCGETVFQIDSDFVGLGSGPAARQIKKLPLREISWPAYVRSANPLQKQLDQSSSGSFGTDDQEESS